MLKLASRAITFELAPLEEDELDENLADADIAGLSLQQLPEAALQPPAAPAGHSDAKRNAYRRSAAVRAYTLARANGICEGCLARSPRPSVPELVVPTLEPHHTRRLSDGGPDHPAAVMALCPTCHRRAHYAEDGAEYNDMLIARLLQIEGPIAKV